MQKIFKQILVLSLIILTSCNGSDDDATTTSNSVFKATINGVEWVASEFKSSNGLIQYPITSEQLFQLTASSNGIQLSVRLTATQISDCMSVGSYDFPNRIEIAYQTVNGDWITGHFYDTDTNGNRIMTLNVISCENNVISGTFSGSYTGASAPGSATNVVIGNGSLENISFDVSQI